MNTAAILKEEKMLLDFIKEKNEKGSKILCQKFNYMIVQILKIGNKKWNKMIKKKKWKNNINKEQIQNQLKKPLKRLRKNN